MSREELSPALRALVNQHIYTMDHVALLLAMKDRPDAHHSVTSLAQLERLDGRVVELVLRDLTASHLAHREHDGFRYAPGDPLRQSVEELLEMYQKKPVTLVRAIYNRPARAPQLFADAFRLRKDDP